MYYMGKSFPRDQLASGRIKKNCLCLVRFNPFITTSIGGGVSYVDCHHAYLVPRTSVSLRVLSERCLYINVNDRSRRPPAPVIGTDG